MKCLCDCGKEAKEGNRYILGHHLRMKEFRRCSELKGKTYEEIYGEEKAKRIEKISRAIFKYNL